MPKCAAKGTARATEASTSKGATIELERAMPLRKKRRLRSVMEADVKMAAFEASGAAELVLVSEH